MSRRGTVALVGAGPGDPGLLTLRAHELLREADVVFLDRLVSPEIVDLVPAHVERHTVGKTGGRPDRTTPQPEIQRRLLEFARRGLQVVRLKGGDPLVFGRGYEELEFLQEAGIAVEIVPGVTSALAAMASAHIPATHRGMSRSISITTPARARGQAQPLGGLDADTVCLLMPLARIEELRAELLRRGRSPRTPAALIERATWPEERCIRTDLESLSRVATEHELRSPTLVVVGDVAALAGTGGKSLRGRRLLLTRPRRPARRLRSAAAARGASAHWCPLIDVRPLPRAIWSTNPSRLDRWDWIAFASPHGVRGFFDELERRGLDARSLHANRLAVVGPKTGDELAKHGLEADLIATPARAHALVRQLIEADGERVLFARGTLARETVPRALRGAGLRVDTVDVYTTRKVAPSERTVQELEQGSFDAVLLHSPSAVESLCRSAAVSPATLLACVGPRTAEAARHAFPLHTLVLPRAGGYGDDALLDALEHSFDSAALPRQPAFSESSSPYSMRPSRGDDAVA
ncbi:MAG: uroporphyrinogen-III C-methyltransferase [Acidobacteriota bacterium]